MRHSGAEPHAPTVCKVTQPCCDCRTAPDPGTTLPLLTQARRTACRKSLTAQPSCKDEAAVEAPGEGAEVAREVLGRDGAVGGQEAVFDVGEHGICPAEGGVSGGGAIGAGDVALVGDTRLPRNATKPLPAVADDGGSGFDTGA